MKVEQFHANNQNRIYEDNKNYLQSYDSLVVKIEDDKITLGKNWDYSKTTLKYVYMFLEEYSEISFYGITNKKDYIRKLIEDKKIKYDEEME